MCFKDLAEKKQIIKKLEDSEKTIVANFCNVIKCMHFDLNYIILLEESWHKNYEVYSLFKTVLKSVTIELWNPFLLLQSSVSAVTVLR